MYPRISSQNYILAMTEVHLSGDRTVGRLIKWLRAMGLDVSLSEAPIPERLHLTRRRSLLKKPGVLVFWADRVEEQIKELFRQCPQLKAQMRPFSRCLRCNSLLVPAKRDEVFGLVPDFIYETHSSFFRCPDCGRIYWPGGHRRRMERRLKDYLPS